MPEGNAYSAQSWNLEPLLEGETVFYLRLPKGARVRSAQLEVDGAPHEFWEDLLAPEYGATMTPIEAGPDEEWNGLVVDFHALRATNSLRFPKDWANEDRFCRLQAWAGITWYQPQPVNNYVRRLSEGVEAGVGLSNASQRLRLTFPELEVQKLMLSFYDTGDTSTPINTLEDIPLVTMPTARARLELHCRSTPSNLSFRIGDGPPIWTYYGSLSKTLTTPDFAKALNEYLASDASPAEEHHVPLTVRSDTLGEVHVSLTNLDYFFVVDRFADGAEEKTLSFTCQGPWTQTVEFELPDGAEVKKATVNLSGSFADDCFVEGHGPLDKAAGEYAVLVSPDHWPAQEIVLDERATLTGVDLYLTRISERAEFTVEMQSDVNRAPSGAALAVVDLSLDPATNKVCWRCLDLPSQVELAAGKSYWLLLKAKEGQASWQVRSGEAELSSLRYSKDEGVSWIDYDLTPWGQGEKIVGWFRLRHLPAAYLLPINVAVGTSSIDLTGFARLEKVGSSVNLKAGLANKGKIPLGITANSWGQVILSNLRIEYGLLEP